MFEIKSRFRRDTVQAAIAHLMDLKPLFQKPSIEDRYASWLRDDFFCGVIFFELAQADVRDTGAIKAMLPEELPKGFIGGIILRAEGVGDQDASARIKLGKSATAGTGSDILRGNSLLKGAIYVETVARGIEPEYPFLGVFMHWFQVDFSTFAFDVLALLTGTYRAGFVSSFHGHAIPAAP